MILNRVIFLFLMFLGVASFGQTEEQISWLNHYKDSLILLRNKTLLASNNSERETANNLFNNTLSKVLSQDVSFRYNFDSIPSLGVLQAPDKSFRLITWNFPYNDGTHLYYCYLQRLHKKKRLGTRKTHDIQTVFFRDVSNTVAKAEKKVLSSDKWYGALYYEIIPVKKGGKTYYTLLGWDGNDQFTAKKIIDVMYFAGGQIKFGAPIFKLGKSLTKRVIFEYSSDAVMSLKYDGFKKYIIYDHLSPIREDLEGIRQYYVPDMSFDALKYSKDKWEYVPDYDARNKENILMPYTDPE